MDMNVWICVIIAGLIAITAVLVVKIYLIKKSTREIRRSFEEKLTQDTNTLIHISSHDPDMRALAGGLNAQLQIFHEGRQKFEHGDLELKEAVTNISHDLRTPLTAIYGYLKLLENEECSETARDYLAAIGERTRALKQLTEELFRYSVFTTSSDGASPEPVVLNRLLEESISAYYGALKQHRITPRITLPERNVIRHLNRNACSRIFGNLISNAIKYSDGDLDITLGEDGEITFSNHAAHLDEIQAGRLFDRFYTVETASAGSTGLGLSIARALTEQMGGSIDAVYEDGILSVRLFFRSETPPQDPSQT